MPRRSDEPSKNIEVDEYCLDSTCVRCADGDPLILGRPVLTVITDLATRHILGFSIGRGGPEHETH